jgi:ferric-dicitrate binding protein FerR (iron transport regulator)
LNLSGEAYFEVTRNEEIPFKVHTEELDVKVLGTKFNFRNYKDDLEAKVCLLEGKVALNTRQKETILHPDQQALLDKKTGKLFVSGTKAAYSAEWTNDRLYFDEVLLSDIIKELERSYDVKITVADDTLNTIRFYGNFRKREQSIQEIMNVLSSTDKMTYTMNGKNIVITLPK